MNIVFTLKSKTDDRLQDFHVPLDGRLVLGRDPDSAVPLSGTGISREHVAVECEDSGLFVTDLSSNGTWLNGERIPRGRRCKVTEADSIDLPGYEMRLHVAGAERELSSPAAPDARPDPSSPAGKGAPPWRSFLHRTVGSLTGLERFVILLATLSLGLLVFYLTS